MPSHAAASLAGLLLACSVAQACANPPRKALDEARAAIEVARSAEAEVYAPTELAAAVAALEQAEATATQRDFRLALSQALEATGRAQNAAKTARQQRAAIGSQAERAVRDIELAVDRLRAAIAAAENARPPRPSRLAVSDARRAIVVANVALQKAREALGVRDYTAVRAACAGVIERLTAVNAALAKAAPPAARRQPY